MPVTNLNITLAGTTNTASSITFDPVHTTKIKLDMISPSPNSATTGKFQISELQLIGSQATANTTAALDQLVVNCVGVTGFAPTTFEYTVGVGAKQTPGIFAHASTNGRMAILTPLSVPGDGSVKVTSEDGLTTKTYVIHFTAGGLKPCEGPG